MFSFNIALLLYFVFALLGQSCPPSFPQWGASVCAGTREKEKLIYTQKGQGRPTGCEGPSFHGSPLTVQHVTALNKESLEDMCVFCGTSTARLCFGQILLRKQLSWLKHNFEYINQHLFLNLLFLCQNTWIWENTLKRKYYV